ncbi:hypothetical protein DFH28DRAFT_884299 [Melampsora americana]|nr:hypothetical protein DFH28DRAFT_884299 [Melampsora americana]
MRLSYFLLLTLPGIIFINGNPTIPELWKSATRFEPLPDGFEIVSKHALTNEEKHSLFIDIDLSDSGIEKSQSSRIRRPVQSVVQMLEYCFPSFVSRIRSASSRFRNIRSLWDLPNRLVIRLHHVE